MIKLDEMELLEQTRLEYQGERARCLDFLSRVGFGGGVRVQLRLILSS